VTGVKRFFSLVTFSHTIFALPFALLAAVLAAGGAPGLRTLLGILLAMAGARSAAMAFNRIVDRDVDAVNR
jgi:4-hydroxybenzoate polyprenyltransferase